MDRSEIARIPESCVIHEYQVYNKLSRINIRKSPGPDCIPNWFLRDYAFAITEPICRIFSLTHQLKQE